MPSDPTKPLLRLDVGEHQRRRPGKKVTRKRPLPFDVHAQGQKFGPQIDQLTELLKHADPVTADPTALAPEKLLVFEVRGSVQNFANAVRRVPGLELVDEEELASDDQDVEPAAYLMVPNAAALAKIESMWRIWQRQRALDRGLTPWRDLFATLRNLRRWGPQDRVQPDDGRSLLAELNDRDDSETVRLEVELVFRNAEEAIDTAQTLFRETVERDGGKVVSWCRIVDIGYHAALVECPVPVARQIAARAPATIAGLDLVMHIRPQSVASTIEVRDVAGGPGAPIPAPQGEPILALLDGVPIAGHPLLRQHTRIDDQFDLVRPTGVEPRRHGTAMASLIIHGDRNRAEVSLPRPIHFVPVMSSGDQFPDDRLIVDMIYTAVLRMRGDTASAPEVLIVNLSLGNTRKLFHGRLSPWARLIDRLAHKYGILFLVSAGNHDEAFVVPDLRNATELQDATPAERTQRVIRALDNIKADRRLLSPAEAVNAITVGAANIDAVDAARRLTARHVVDPFPEVQMANSSSALGPGFANSVKPDLLMPGSREHLRFVSSGTELVVRPSDAASQYGLKVAAPPARDGLEGQEGFTNGSSAAAALASRTCHLIHDALEQSYGELFSAMSSAQRAVLLKALLVHTAKWPAETHHTLLDIIGPRNAHHTVQKDNIRRFLGYGLGDPDLAVACAADRATFWAAGELGPDQGCLISVPLPRSAHAQPRLHWMSATLAWFTPTLPKRQSYRAIKMSLHEPDGLADLRVDSASSQPDANQARRGTVISRHWGGEKAPVIGEGQVIDFFVQRDADQGPRIDELNAFGLAITFAMPGVQEIYDEVRARVSIQPRAPVMVRP